MTDSYYNYEIKCDTFIKSVKQCPLCEWNIIDCCGNFGDVVVDKFGEIIGDYFAYCGNKGCENHKGVWYLNEDVYELLGAGDTYE